MKPIVTVAVASYNNEHYIGRCINSVLNQTYKELEVIIVDDGSTDKTSEILEKYENGRIRIIFKENGGLSSTRQRALDEAKGAYISFIDADDYLSTTYIEKLLNKIMEDDSDICVCSTKMEDSRGYYLTQQSRNFACKDTITPIQYQKDQFKNIVPRMVTELYLSDSWNKLYKMAFLKNIDVRFCMEKGLNGSDTIFNQLVFLHSPRYSTISSAEYNHVIYPKSAAHRKERNLLKPFQFIINEMILESKRISQYNNQCGYIINLYGIYLMESFADLYQQTLKRKEMYKRLCMMNKSRQFFMEQNQIVFNDNIRLSISVRWFIRILNIHYKLLPIYFQTLKLLTSIRH